MAEFPKIDIEQNNSREMYAWVLTELTEIWKSTKDFEYYHRRRILEDICTTITLLHPPARAARGSYKKKAEEPTAVELTETQIKEMQKIKPKERKHA